MISRRRLAPNVFFNPISLARTEDRGRHEVDVINHGEGDEQQADGAEQSDLGQVAAGSEVEFEVGMEIDIGERLGDKGDSFAAGFPLLYRF